MTRELGKIFKRSFRVADLTMVNASVHWTWSCSSKAQPTLGAGILSLNKPCSRWSDAGPAAMSELDEVIATIEHRTQKLFRYDRINYMMLMMDDHAGSFPRISALCGASLHSAVANGQTRLGQSRLIAGWQPIRRRHIGKPIASALVWRHRWRHRESRWCDSQAEFFLPLAIFRRRWGDVTDSPRRILLSLSVAR